MKVLLVAAMPTESKDLIKRFGMILKGKFANFFPYYSVTRNDKEIFLLQTYVGSINASTAVALALEKIKPDAVIKVGCIGGNTPGFKKNDIVVPLSFFHSGAWITRSYKNNQPTRDASLWQNFYGDKPYQSSKHNLGGLDYVLKPNKSLTNKYKNILNRKNILYTEAHLGSGDMVIFDRKFMNNICQNILKLTDDNIKCATDNESYSIAQVCQIFNIPFTGVYFIASSDYEDIDGYNSGTISLQTQQTILPIIAKIVDEL
ncbi:MAG: hypothetical protein M1120_01815 [Patescibacteria group bacterium]|nr:hypothetical protein [Patescibacteria group bacterium]